MRVNYREVAQEIADLRAQKKAVEDQEKALRSTFEAKYPPGSDIPADYALVWGTKTALECDNPAKIDPTLTKVVIDTPKVRAYQKLHEGLPKGVRETESYALNVR